MARCASVHPLLRAPTRETPLKLFAACLPGLEPLLATELRALDARSVTERQGGVAYEGDATLLIRSNLELGLASHVLLRLERFPARGFAELVRKVARMPWSRTLHPGAPLDVHVAARQSRLYHTGAIEERIRTGIGEALGVAPPAPPDDPKGPVARLHVRMFRDECTLSLDTSGEPLHRRGWRLETGKAPLREDLARALVLTSGWDRRSPLLDPFCGSGTVVVEAALLAMDRAPGLDRSFALEATRVVDPASVRVLRDAARERAVDRPPAPLVGTDRNPAVVDAALANAERAGVEGVVFSRAAISDAPWLSAPGDAPPSGAIVTNPPFGKRVRGRGRRQASARQGLVNLYQTFGAAVRALPDAWTVTLLTTDRRLAHKVGHDLRTAFLTRHGGLKVRAMTSAPA